MASKRLLTSRHPSNGRQGLQEATATTRSTDTTAILVAQSNNVERMWLWWQNSVKLKRLNASYAQSELKVL